VQRAAAIVMAQWARERVPLYRELYAGAPLVQTWSDFRRLPVLTTARLRASPLCDQVDTLDDVLRSQTAYALESVVTPRTLVLDADDTDAAFDQTHLAFTLLGVRRGTRVALVASPLQRYFAAEIADQLGYFRVEAHLVIGRDPRAISRTLAALAPDLTVSLGVPPSCTSGRVTVRQPAPRALTADLYIVPEAGIVAVRPAGELAYRVLTRYFLVETTPGRNLLLTALRRYHQPLIRYELPDRGRLARGRLLLQDVAP
jgi:hypothetical protein